MDKACAFSGHRVIKKNFDYCDLYKVIDNIIESGYNFFYVGMARGFDLECCKILIEYKKKYKNINITACIPCKEQEKYFSEREKEEYINCLKSCDQIKYISEEYIKGCMQMRNRYMIDNCDLLLAYLYKNSGGTFYTVKYAEKKNKEIIFI